MNDAFILAEKANYTRTVLRAVLGVSRSRRRDSYLAYLAYLGPIEFELRSKIKKARGIISVSTESGEDREAA